MPPPEAVPAEPPVVPLVVPPAVVPPVVPVVVPPVVVPPVVPVVVPPVVPPEPPPPSVTLMVTAGCTVSLGEHLVSVEIGRLTLML
ncbi:hypothetical protein DDE74_15650 [Streptomyces lydicus]|uniref:Uncharacterized protein n=1 Tax=Streptomyces lydicus TaxID=47763 RepID=A0A3Q9KA43_9ACTN|nr:hypothetical protein DDE74_15650 [Streptomyces lydicus]